MEWNREEGIKAKEIAEKKLIANDIMGAKKFALKAQTLYPNLEDWYGILGVDPKADDDTIRKQYRKLALMLHPDKNNSIGADDAFKLILEAWNLLSNKEQRDAYDKERNKAKMSSHDDQNLKSLAICNNSNSTILRQRPLVATASSELQRIPIGLRYRQRTPGPDLHSSHNMFHTWSWGFIVLWAQHGLNIEESSPDWKNNQA
ncbi:hypothetical protein G4B88_010433 [Cannabis sativa]|uniref:J domain-containing protein n=1 Tax=Cannabis sativa TaxID=3483 RepID=A0A7J6I7F7_CANSA|nr:hypothetical protein G4B88_010433 [Cannabis sativa]